VRFFFVGLDEEGSSRKMDARDELLSGILDVADGIKKHEDQLRRATRDLHTRFAKCTEDGGIIEHTLCTVTNLSFVCKKFVT